MKKEYLKQDINNPKYLFHGSSNKLDVIKPNLSYDSNNNKNNVDNAIFLTPIFLKATAYAFKDTIKKNSDGLDWDFIISNLNDFPVMKMKNVRVDNDMVGYVYVFKYNNYMFKDENSYQYKCYNNLIPIDVIEVCYKDYSYYYEMNNDKM